MKHAHIIVCLLMLLSVNSICAREPDSLVLKRMFNYHHNYHHKIDSFTTNCYTKYFYNTQRRNFALWMIPNMYPFAKGERQYVREQFSQVNFEDFDNIKLRQDLSFTTVPHNQKPLSVLNEFSIPQLYSTTLYGNHILSPFHPDNKMYYHYRVKRSGVRQAIVEFKPRWGNNTQLVTGKAMVLISTGRILDVDIKGEYDMINFHTTIYQGYELKKTKSTLPMSIKTDINFRFLGNHITSSFVSVYNLPDLPANNDSTLSDRQLIAKIRPMNLTKSEKAVLARYDSANHQKAEVAVKDTTTQTISLNTLKNIGWDVGSYLLRSHEAGDQRLSFKLSPIIYPQYLNYSHSHGLSYKLKFSILFDMDTQQKMEFLPTLGYNFKIHKFYYQLPLRYTYNKQKDNFLELTWNNGNRIANSSVLEELKGEFNELPEQDEYDLTIFNDNRLRLVNSMRLTKWLRLEEGLVYHRRTAVNKEYMRKYNKPEVYNSLAPSITCFLEPIPKGPMLSINYEHALRLKAFQMSYDRWEATASQIFRLLSTQFINFRLGGGLYTSKHNNYFMSYANFSENYLEGGWDDDWSGEFQLLDSRLYNLSRYYLNSNITFDSPLMMMSFLPYFGHYVERERIYWSGLLIQHSRPYWELGYGFTTSTCTIGLFSSFLDFSFQEIGAKFTLELFRRW